MRYLFPIILIILLCNYSTAQDLGLQVDRNLDAVFGRWDDAPGNTFFWNYQRGAIKVGNRNNISAWQTDSMGYGSASFGTLNVAFGDYTLAGGSNNRLFGTAAASWGSNNIATEDYGTIWGNRNMNLAAFGTIWGRHNVGRGWNSTVWGEGNFANSTHETVLGRYADTSEIASATNWHENDYLFVVGNGLDEGHRSNALTIRKNGDVSVDRHLILDGHDASTYASPGLDNGVIHVAPDSSSSDLILVANDDVTIHLDEDDGEDSEFRIQNGKNTVTLMLDELGNLRILGTLYQGSDRKRKKDISSVDKEIVLTKLMNLPVSAWRYQQDSITHFGPMAQDFFKMFGLGTDDKTISVTDGIGVAYAAIQAIGQRQQDLMQEVGELKLLVKSLTGK